VNGLKLFYLIHISHSSGYHEIDGFCFSCSARAFGLYVTLICSSYATGLQRVRKVVAGFPSSAGYLFFFYV
jgi:hypothetical protein